jgi:hypothetical protein
MQITAAANGYIMQALRNVGKSVGMNNFWQVKLEFGFVTGIQAVTSTSI